MEEHNTSQEQPQESKQKPQQEKHPHGVIAAIAYVVFFVPLLGGSKNEPFVRYHVRQGIGLLITALALQGILSLFGYFAGYSLALPLRGVIRIFLIVMVILGITNALKGAQKPLPLIGKYAAKL